MADLKIEQQITAEIEKQRNLLKDIDGRTKLYNSLVRGNNTPQANIPESFNVLVKELEGLGLDVILD